MSICIDYYFNHPHDLSALAQEINGWVGCTLSPYEENPEDLFCRFFGMELCLSKHTLANDRELDFEDFTYHLSIRTPVPDADLRSMQLPAVALMAYALYRRMGIAGMLVYDVQILLARYEERLDSELNEARMFDVVSGKIVRFPAHLDSLYSRLPESAR